MKINFSIARPVSSFNVHFANRSITMLQQVHLRVSSNVTRVLRISKVYTSSPNISTIRRTLHVAIIGSGPSAFYTAKYLLEGNQMHNNNSATNNFKIDMLESLPVPYGLIRYGVAPDHPEVKSVSTQFQSLIEKNKDNFRFYGNLTIGKDIDFNLIYALYDCVVIAIGAQSYVKLDLPIESLSCDNAMSSSTSDPVSVSSSMALNNMLSAREFVNWYNGHPDNVKLFDQHMNDSKLEHVVLIGQGNVALDCARILVCDKSRLESTDISSLAFDKLFPRHPLSSSIFKDLKTITLIGRRGPLQIACTIKELRELTNLSTSNHLVDVDMDQSAVDSVSSQLTAAADGGERLKNELNANRPKKRIFELIQKISQKTAVSSPTETQTVSTTPTNDTDLYQNSQNHSNTNTISKCLIKFKFFRSPISLQTVAQDGVSAESGNRQIKSIKLEINSLTPHTIIDGASSNETSNSAYFESQKAVGSYE